MPPGRAGKSPGANPVTATGEPVPQMPASPPGPEGEPQPETPRILPAAGQRCCSTADGVLSRNGVTPPPQVTYQSVPVPNRIQRKVFTRNEGKQGPSLPYIPSGSFAKAMLIEGRMPMPQSPVMNPRCRCSCVSPARWKCRTARRMTQRDVLWGWKPGDVSSERAIVRTRNISCLKDGKTIDMPIKGMSASG